MKIDLDDNQLDFIVDEVVSQFGLSLSKPIFTEVCYQLFEDVSGFEVVDDSYLESICKTLWEKYHGKRTSDETNHKP